MANRHGSFPPKKSLANVSVCILETMNCQTCQAPMQGRKRKYCKKECQPSFKRSGRGLDNCQHCGKSLAGLSKTGRARRNCSDRCRNLHANKTKKAPMGEILHNCKYCQKEFKAKAQFKFCSKKCVHTSRAEYSKSKRHAEYRLKHPDGLVTVTCGWCKEPRSYPFGTSTVTAYHPKCTVEATRARYRIKTVKRQTKLHKPSRLAADEVVRVYGQNCSICGGLIDLSLKRSSAWGLTVDHYIPLSKGGSDDMDNLRPAHWTCNRKKSDKLPEELNA